MTIRTITGRDTQAVVALWNRTLVRDPITPERFANWLFADPDFDTDTGDGAWVADLAGEVMGFVRAIRRRFPNDHLGVEPDLGWLPAIFVAPEHERNGLGGMLLQQALGFLQDRGVKQVWVCGNTGSAPGYLFPGVDKDAYAQAIGFFKQHGFQVDREPVAMSRPLLDFDTDEPATTDAVSIHMLTPDRVMPFLAFLRTSFPGDWNIAARNKLRAGGMGQVLVAVEGETVVGYCQWEPDGHFGPFGVRPDQRGRGLGRRLFLEASRRMKRLDIRHVWFNWADADAERFYQRLGLTPTRRFAILRKDLPA